MPVLTRTTRYTSKTDIAVVLGIPGSALALLSGETQGFAIDATTAGGSVAVIDTGTPANNKNDVLLNSSNLVQTGTSGKVVKWNDGTLHSFAVGQIAQEYDGSRFGILIEPAATNLQVRSQEFDDAGWTKTNISISANATTAPDGTLTADSIIENTVTGSHELSHTAVSSGVTYGVSIFAKSRGTSRYLTLQGGGIGTASEIPNWNLDAGTVAQAGTSTVVKSVAIESIGNGWYRCSAIVTTGGASAFLWVLANVPTANAPGYTGDNASGLYIWGAQYEQTAYVTSYIATTSATVTRNSDAIGCATSTYPHSNATGTFILWIKPRIVDEATANRLFDLNDGTVNEMIHLALITGDTPDSFGLTITDGGAAQVVSSTTKTGSASLSGNKVAAFYKLNDSGVLAGGGSEVTDVAATMPTVTAFNLGYDAVTANTVFNGYIYQMTYVPRRMTTLEMQTRTA